MIDIHTHILPGIDDGAKDLTESLALLKLAENDGITHMVATPHIHVGRFNNATAQIKNDLESLKQEAHKEGINVKLAAAAEVRLDIELMAMVMANKLPFIGKIADKNVLLLELPHSHMPQGTLASSIMRLAADFEPIASMALAGGPTKIIPASSQARQKAAFSDRKP